MRVIVKYVLYEQERVNFTDNVDVVTYVNGKRETHNPTGRAYAPVVWDFFQASSAKLYISDVFCDMKYTH